MDRGIPVSSKLISKKINDKNMQIHLQKLQNIKSSISREPPKSFSHLKSNKKKVQVHEAKLGEIERENRLLLEKLTTIMKTGGPQEYQSNRVTPKSLNRDYRKRELVKITIENQAFLKRLQDLKPTYNRSNWENDRKQHELYLKNISEFPGGVSFIKSPQEGDRPSTYQNPNAFSLTTSGSEQHNQMFSASTKNSAGQFNSVKKQAQTKLDPVPLSTQKTILFQTKKKIGFSNYLIHIYAHNNTFNIIASNNNRSDFKTLSVSREEGIDLLRQFGENYEELLNHIQFKGSNIIIKNSSYSVETSHDQRDHNVSQEGIAETQEEYEPKSSKSHKSKVPLDHQTSEESKREQEEKADGSKDENKSAEVEEQEKAKSQSDAKEHKIEDEETVKSEKGETTPLEKATSQEYESLENERRQAEESQERHEKSLSQKAEPRNPSPDLEQEAEEEQEQEEKEKKEEVQPDVINVQDEEEENYPEDNEQLENSQGEETKKFVSPADEEEDVEAVDEDL